MPSPECSNPRLSAALALAPVPVFLLDAAGRFVDCNEALARVLGVGRDALLSFDLANILPAGPFAAVQRALAGETASWVGDYESPFAPRVVRANLTVAPVCEDGVLQGAIGFVSLVEPAAGHERTAIAAS